MPRVGTVLVDRYRLEEAISEGAMGRVYRAKDMTLGIDVAVKVILGQWLQNEQVRARFEREAMASARIHHPNVVSAMDYGPIDDTGGAYLVTPLIAGQNLREYLQGPLPLTEAISVTTQLCSALRVAHQCGIIHRDLKPENIILERIDDALFVRLVDFGIASETDNAGHSEGTALTQAGMVLGTPGYMAPEQLSGEPAQPATDVYALGVLLYEMLTGAAPFDGGLAELAAQQVNHQVEMDALRARAPQRICDLVFHSLQPKPDARPTLDAFGEAIERAELASIERERVHARWEQVRAFLLHNMRSIVITMVGLGLGLAAMAALSSGIPEELEEPVAAMQNAKNANVRRRAAETIAAYEPQEDLPENIRHIAAFERARSCSARKKALLDLAQLESQEEVLPIYRRLDADRDGCGFLNRSDCHRCLRGDLAKILKDANESM